MTQAWVDPFSGLPSPPVNAVGASAGRRAGAPAPAEALPSPLGGRRSDESEGKGFGKAGFDHRLVHFLLRRNGPSYGRTPDAKAGVLGNLNLRTEALTFASIAAIVSA